MNTGDKYVVNSATTLYRLPNSSCSEGDTVTLANTVVERVYLVNGDWVQGDIYTTGTYNSTSYVCHVWDGSKQLNINYLILPSVLIVLCLFAIIYRWFIRLRG